MGLLFWVTMVVVVGCFFVWRRRGECGEMGREEMRKGRMGRMSGDVVEMRALLELGGVGGREKVSVL